VEAFGDGLENDSAESICKSSNATIQSVLIILEGTKMRLVML